MPPAAAAAAAAARWQELQAERDAGRDPALEKRAAKQAEAAPKQKTYTLAV